MLKIGYQRSRGKEGYQFGEANSVIQVKEDSGNRVLAVEVVENKKRLSSAYNLK